MGANSSVSGTYYGDNILSGSSVSVTCGPDKVLVDISLSTVSCFLGTLSGLPTCQSGTTTSTTTTRLENITTFTVMAALTTSMGANSSVSGTYYSEYICCRIGRDPWVCGRD